MLKLIKLHINGKDEELAFDSRESLADTLRRRMHLTGLKKGCEVGECGACTVLIDGVAIDSCLYLTEWAVGKKILTVEGLRQDTGELTPVQQAFVDEAAVQCGFCTPGIIMSAVELMESNERYSRDELRKKISGHLCRCTGYENILNALEKVVGHGV